MKIEQEILESPLDIFHFQSRYKFTYFLLALWRQAVKLNYGCEGFLGRYEGEVRDNFFFCRAGINIASILADGSISACPNLRENFIQGNIYRDNFAEMWQNRYQKYRDRSWTKTGICKDCQHFSHCQGNGMHLRDEKSGELLFCHLKRLEEGEKA